MKPVLVDTSVWRAFFAGRTHARPMRALLNEPECIAVHPLVVGELVLGGLSLSQERLLGRLLQATRIDTGEVLAMIRRRRLTQRGVGWVDAELLASALNSGLLVWSLDAALANVAREIGIGFDVASMHAD